MCTLLVTQSVPCLASDGELTWFLMCTLLVTQTMASLASEGEFAWFSQTVAYNTNFHPPFLGGELLYFWP